MNADQGQTRRQHLLFVVSAPSGAGKTSICRTAAEQLPGLTFSVSHTTRPPRTGETDGKNYHFVSRDEFQKAVSNNQMAEWTEIYGNCYGTTVDTIQRELDNGLDVLFDIDERGARQLKEVYPELVTILVLPPSLDVLRQRLVDRQTDDEQTVQMRLKQSAEEIRSMSWYRYVIVNDRLDKAVNDLKSIIIAERCRRDHELIEVLLNGGSAP